MLKQEVQNEYVDNKDVRSRIVLEGALDNITINEFVYFLTLINRDAYTITITNETVHKMISSAFKKEELKEIEIKPADVTLVDSVQDRVARDKIM
jgi:hypothetical protein